MWVPSLAWEDPLEKGMATHSSVLAWKIPWTEEPGRLQSIRLQRVRHSRLTLHPVSLSGAGSRALAARSPDEKTEAVRAQVLARSKSQVCRPVASGVSRPGLCRSTRLAPDPRGAGSSEGIAGLWAEDTWPAGPRGGFLLLVLSSG